MTSNVSEARETTRIAASNELSHIRVYLQATFLISLLVTLFAQVLLDMANDWWRQPELSQGMLLPPLAALLAWTERRRVLRYPAKMDSRGLLLTTGACLLFLLGKFASEFFLMRISFVVLLAGVVCTFWGIQRLRALSFPLLLLAAMVPLPVIVYNSAAVPLQMLASDVAAQVAQALGVSVFRDGNVIQLAGISLGVAEACSGLSCLSALVVGSLFLGRFICSSWTGRIILIALAVPLAIAVNVMRVAGTAVLADYDQAFAMGFYHSFSGWLVFLVGTFALYAAASLIHCLIDTRKVA